MKIGPVEIDFNALAALVAALTAAYSVYKGNTMRREAKALPKEERHEGENQDPRP